MLYVTKADGKREPFSKRKVMRTCRKIGASEKLAGKVASRIEDEAQDGISTKEILERIYEYIAEEKPEIRQRTDLRSAISRMSPKPDFELFVRFLLDAHGFQVRDRRRVRGKCLQFEVDAVADRDDETFFVEVKHHYKPHTYTTLPVCLETKAKLEDVRAGFEEGLNNIRFDKALIICNTKFTAHARRYAKCAGIDHVGWNTPTDSSMERLIETSGQYPITILTRPDEGTLSALSQEGIMTLRQLMKRDAQELSQTTRVPRAELNKLQQIARGIID